MHGWKQKLLRHKLLEDTGCGKLDYAQLTRATASASPVDRPVSSSSRLLTGCSASCNETYHGDASHMCFNSRPAFGQATSMTCSNVCSYESTLHGNRVELSRGSAFEICSCQPHYTFDCKFAFSYEKRSKQSKPSKGIIACIDLVFGASPY